MKSFTYVIRDKEGIHARPAGIVVNEAKKFKSNITIKSNGRSADIKRIFGLMGLCIKCGQTVEIVAEGEDEEAAVTALESAFKSNL